MPTMDDAMLGKALRDIWEDQRAFNTLFRQQPKNTEELAAQTSEFVLNTESELHELLRAMKWKKHRRPAIRDNQAHLDDELADILKCVMSLLQIHGFTPERAIEAYWRKTAVVRQRYSEEWSGQLTGPCAVVDIDQVLCNFIGGMCAYLRSKFPYQRKLLRRIDNVERDALWINGDALELDESDWQNIKHEFRVSGAKRQLPAFDDAAAFLGHLREQGLKIILLTSRPIDQYPNLYTDTLLWLQDHKLPFDYLWWASNKTERMLQDNVHHQIKLVVDDDPNHLAGFARLGIPCYLLRRETTLGLTPEQIQPFTLVRTLGELRFNEKE
jgi:NTP pyrophosphatase (non-canonical NTP hydrolase)